MTLIYDNVSNFQDLSSGLSKMPGLNHDKIVGLFLSYWMTNDNIENHRQLLNHQWMNVGNMRPDNFTLV